MRYFTREQEQTRDNPNVDRSTLREQFALLDQEYRRQLKELEHRLSPSAQDFFENVSLHDGTLLLLRIGDDVEKSFARLKTKIVNCRKLRVALDVLNHEETKLYRLRYERIRRLVFDFPSVSPWHLRFDDPAATPVDDWMLDELTAADNIALRHEVVFSSGATLLVEFESVEVEMENVLGRDRLPLVNVEPE